MSRELAISCLNLEILIDLRHLKEIVDNSELSMGLVNPLGWVGLGPPVDGLGWIGSHKIDPLTTLRQRRRR